MRLIHMQGMNCYVSCLVSIAALMGVEDPVCYATLWSETDFIYDGRHAVFTSKRISANLAALGCRLTSFAHEPQSAVGRELAALRAGEYAAIGMDAFFLPWSPVYLTLHDPHYFIAEKDGSDGLLCYDPTYGQAGMRIPEYEAALHGYDFVRGERCAPAPPCAGVAREAREILRKHPCTREDLLERIKGCIDARQHATPLARYMGALLNNRLLFWHYASQTPDADTCSTLFTPNFFSRWEAIKNGMYKASLTVKNKDALGEACELLCRVFDEEAACARALADAEREAGRSMPFGRGGL